MLERLKESRVGISIKFLDGQQGEVWLSEVGERSRGEVGAPSSSPNFNLSRGLAAIPTSEKLRDQPV